MKLTKTKEFEDLKPESTFQKRKINNFAVLTPKLAEAVQKTNMSPQEVMLAIVEQIKAVTDSSSSTAAATNTDAILKTMGAPYEDVLRFI